nr:hypothetical protein [Streptomyces antimycoticus]
MQWRLFLPKEWASDTGRRATTRIPNAHPIRSHAPGEVAPGGGHARHARRLGHDAAGHGR